MAFHLGKTKTELLRDLSGSRELGEWMAYFDKEPPGQQSDERSAAIQAAVYGSQGAKVKTTDFLPKRKRQFRPIKDRIQDVINIFKAIG